MTDKQFYRSMRLATFPRMDGRDATRWQMWNECHYWRFGWRLPWPKQGHTYISPTYPGNADRKAA